uniref:Uncharacterized protein n=1 Tax=Arundo donax TaxID=35708 RepID=A0A0A9FYP8_ARUDO
MFTSSRLSLHQKLWIKVKLFKFNKVSSNQSVKKLQFSLWEEPCKESSIQT